MDQQLGETKEDRHMDIQAPTNFSSVSIRPNPECEFGQEDSEVRLQWLVRVEFLMTRLEFPNPSYVRNDVLSGNMSAMNSLEEQIKLPICIHIDVALTLSQKSLGPNQFPQTLANIPVALIIIIIIINDYHDSQLRFWTTQIISKINSFHNTV